jgi:hypothetical protein
LIDLGSRRGGDFGRFAGAPRSKSIRSAIEDVQTTLSENEPAKVVVGTAIDVLALSNPAIGTLVATYKVSKALYKMASKANDAYDRTHDANAAIKAAAGEAVHVGVGAARDQAIGSLVDVGWTAIKGSAGVATSELQDRVLTSAAKNTLSEVLPK